MGMKIEVNGHVVEVDDNFANLPEDQQHAQIDEIASQLGPKTQAQTQEEPESKANLVPNLVGGAEAALISKGVGLPKAALGAAKNYFTGRLPTPEPSDLSGTERWFKSANEINEKAKIVRRNTELAQRYPQFQRKIMEETLPIMERLETLRKTTPGKAFVAGANITDVTKHAGQDTLGNVQAGLSATAAAAPFLEKRLPGKLGMAAKVLGLGAPLVNYGVDVMRGPVEEKAAGGLAHLAGGGSLSNMLTQTTLNAPFIAPEGMGIAKNIAKGKYAPAIEDAASVALAMAPLNPLTAGLSLMTPSEAGAGSTLDEYRAQQAAEKAAMEKARRDYEYKKFMQEKVGANAPKFLNQYMSKIQGHAPGGKIKALAQPLFEKFKYDKYKIAQDYPEVIPPVLATDPKTGKEFLKKQLSSEALEVQKARKEAQKQIDAGNYEPFFDISKRYYADPKHYPTAGYTATDIVPKKAETIAKYEAMANDPEALARLRGAFEKAKDRPMAKDWYAMGQLEDAFIKELGPEEGRKQFKNRFADAMAATTGGADPNSNLMMAAYTNYQKGLGKEIPTAAADLPFPIGGRFVSGNMEQARRLADVGEIPVTNPKRHNFSANFLGHRDVSTLDEQMSQLWDPKMMAPPPNAYGIYQQALAKEAERAGVQPANFQDIAWAGAKDYPGKPMMQEINEMIERTHKITGEPKEEILKGFIRGNKPMYGIGALGLAGTQEEDMQPKKKGGKVKKKK